MEVCIVGLGTYLKEVREEKLFSLRDVERLGNVSSGHLSMIEQEMVANYTVEPGRYP